MASSGRTIVESMAENNGKELAYRTYLTPVDFG